MVKKKNRLITVSNPELLDWKARIITIAQRKEGQKIWKQSSLTLSQWIGTDYHLIYFMHAIHRFYSESLELQLWESIEDIFHGSFMIMGTRKVANKVIILRFKRRHSFKIFVSKSVIFCWVRWCRPAFNVVRAILCMQNEIIINYLGT